MRLFFSVAIPADVRQALAGHVDSAGGAEGLVQSRPEALHITLRFIGEVAMGALGAVENIGRAVGGKRFSIAVGGAGIFPDDRHPSVYWTGVQGDVAALSEMAQALDRGLVLAGFPSDNRPFFPHLTLARAKTGARMPAESADRFRRSMDKFVSRFFDIKEIDLIRSHLGPVGPRYEVLRTFPLS